jgi:hypothetical protein
VKVITATAGRGRKLRKARIKTPRAILIIGGYNFHMGRSEVRKLGQQCVAWLKATS